MLQARFRPIEKWPGTPTSYYSRTTPFKAPYSDTLDLLEKELDNVKAKNIIIEAYFNLGQIRNDGWPYSGASPRESGVIVGFDSKHGPMRIHCDACKKWEHNLRAIAFHMNHLRMSGIYGVGKDGQQYRGWKQLPGAIITPPAMTLEEAARFTVKIAGHGAVDWGGVVENVEHFQNAYRLAAKKLHPDANSGRELNEWHQLQDAAAILRSHHQVAA